MEIKWVIKYQKNIEKGEPTFRILAKFTPPLPITLPTALAGISISNVE